MGGYSRLKASAFLDQGNLSFKRRRGEKPRLRRAERSSMRYVNRVDAFCQEAWPSIIGTTSSVRDHRTQSPEGHMTSADTGAVRFDFEDQIRDAKGLVATHRRLDIAYHPRHQVGAREKACRLLARCWPSSHPRSLAKARYVRLRQWSAFGEGAK